MSQYQTAERGKGTSEIWDLLSRYVDPHAKNALDIGCNEAVFGRNLSDCGLFVTAFDVNFDAVGTAIVHKNANFNDGCLVGHYALSPDGIDAMPEYDVVLLLSVHHQWWKNWGPEVANRMLVEVAKKARKQFFFAPACIAEKYGEFAVPFADNDYAAIETYFRSLLEEGCGKTLSSLGMTTNELPPSEPLRPIYLLQSTAPPQSIARPPIIPQGLDVTGSRSRLLDVEMDHCVDGLNLAYTEPGWHYFIAALREYEADPTTPYARSLLRRYYAGFRPENLQVAFGLTGEDVGALGQMPVHVYNPILPWSVPDARTRLEGDQLNIDFVPIPPRDFHRCGPVADEHGAVEWKRITTLYDVMKKVGYRPERYDDGYIRGFLFKDGDEYRFQATAGQHRLAALAALGHQTVRVKLQPGMPAVVDRAQLAEWPWVQRKLYTETQALRIFRSRFDRRGEHARSAV